VEILLAPSSKSQSRRQYTKAFKQKLVDLSYEPGQSIASIAQQNAINANLLHKWRKQFTVTESAEFVRLPAPARPGIVAGVSIKETVRIELPGGVVANWPLDRISDSIGWLKAMTS
jgi:transposase